MVLTTEESTQSSGNNLHLDEISSPRRASHEYTTHLLYRPELSDSLQAPEPITPGEVFNPTTEFEEIKKLPKAERREALESFKQKLVYQTVGAGRMRAAIAQKMRDPYELMNNETGTLMSFQHKYGLPLQVIQSTEVSIEKARERKIQIEEAMTTYSRPELIEQILGFKPNGVVRLARRGITINLHFQDSTDYALFATGFPGQRVSHKTLVHIAQNSDGYFRSEAEAPKVRRPFEGMVIGINDIDPLLATIAQLHEEQHAVTELMRPLDEQIEEPLIEIQDKIDQLDPEEQEAALLAILKSEQTYAFAMAKDEILAIMTENFREQEDILKSLNTTRTKGGFHDYTYNARKALYKAFKRQESFGHFQKEIKDTLIRQHREIVNQAVDALFRLAEVTSTDEAIGILEAVPLDQWSKACARIKKHYKGN